MVRFVHTADWQLGMGRAFLDDDARARFAQARIDAIGAVGEVVREHGAQFVVVAGDVFDSNQTDRRTVVRALEQLASVPVPVLLLPGNHDPLGPGTVYDSASFRERLPANVTVLDDHTARRPVDGAEVVGVPWHSNELLHDAVGELVSALEPRPASPPGVSPGSGVTRVVVAHGIVDRLRVERHTPGAIEVDVVERALAEGRLDFLALGDRHSTTAIGGSGRIWYAGAPEPTRFTEIDPGNVLVVDIGPGRCEVTPVRVGTWSFVQRELELHGDGDVADLRRWFAERRGSARTIVRLRLEGVVPLRIMAALEELLAEAADGFACLDVVGLHRELVAMPDEADVDEVDAGPVTRGTMAELSEVAAGGGVDAEIAAAALGLLYRLARGAA